jgi:hypothetical protein
MIIRGLRAGGSEGVSGCWGGKFRPASRDRGPADTLRTRRQRGSVALRLIPRNLAPVRWGLYLFP